MKGYMRIVAGMSAFMVVFTMILVGGVTANVEEDRLEEYNITREDLSFSPDLPNVQARDIDIEFDQTDIENITVEGISDVSNPEFSSEKVALVENSSSEGYAIYRIDGNTEILTTRVSRTGFFTPSKLEMEEYATPDSSESPIHTVKLNGQQTWDLGDSTNYIKINFLTSDARLYDLTQQNEPRLSAFEAVSAYAGAAGNAASSWFQIFTGLPSSLFWLGAFFLMVGTIIGIELILW